MREIENQTNQTSAVFKKRKDLAEAGAARAHENEFEFQPIVWQFRGLLQAPKNARK
jgi:hypothetical protein